MVLQLQLRQTSKDLILIRLDCQRFATGVLKQPINHTLYVIAAIVP